MSVTPGTSVDQNHMSADIYSKNKNIIVNCAQKAKQVLIYNTLGSILEQSTDIIGLKTFGMDKYPNGYYLVKIITDNDVLTQKVLLK
jgi:hypothetical protein